MGNELDLITLFLKRFEHAPLTASACGSDTRLAQQDLIEPCERLVQRTVLVARSKRGRSAALPLKFPLILLAEGILAGLGLLPCQSERREDGAAFLLLVPLRLRLLLLLVAAHLTLGHGVPPMLACPRARAVGGLKRRRRADSSGVSLALLRRSAASFAVRPLSDERASQPHPHIDYILN